MNVHVQFNRPATLRDDAGVEQPQTFGKGTHQVPEALTTGWFFAALVKDGDAVVLRAAADDAKAASGKADAEAAAKEAALKQFLARPFNEVIDAIAGAQADDLLALRELEEAGKRRTSVLTAINARIEAEAK